MIGAEFEVNLHFFIKARNFCCPGEQFDALSIFRYGAITKKHLVAAMGAILPCAITE